MAVYKKIAFTDSSYDDKRGVAGWGVVIQDGQKQRAYSNWIPASSNNYGELFAIYQAGILMGGTGIIYTDSQAALSYIRREIPDKPRTREQYIRHKHCEFLAYKIRKLKITVDKVKAHNRAFKRKNIGNNLADLYAKQGRAKFYENNT